MAKVGQSLPTGWLVVVGARGDARAGAVSCLVGCAAIGIVAGSMTHCGRATDSASGRTATATGGNAMASSSPVLPNPQPSAPQALGASFRSSERNTVTESPKSPHIVWQFRAASPSAGPPAVSPEGRVYLSTVGGSIHALSAKGQLQWSYTMEGLPQGGPLTTDDGRVYVTTSAGRIYALNPDGTPAWTKRSRTRIVSPAVAMGKSSLVYTSVDGVVRGISLSRGKSWARRLGERIITHPVAAPAMSGVIAVTRNAENSQLWWVSPGSRSVSVVLPQSPVHEPLSLGALTLVVAGGQLLALQPGLDKPIWQTGARLAAADAAGKHLVVVRNGTVSWLEPASGEAIHTVALSERVCAPPLVLADGTVVAPLVSGRALVARRSVSDTTSVSVFNTPLRSPVSAAMAGRSETQHWVVVASGAGEVAMLDLSSWSSSGRSRTAQDAGT